MDRPPGRWAVVLAGGEGVRLRPLIQRLWGVDKPKQFCALTSDKTLLEETLDRVQNLVPLENRVTIIGRGHRGFVNGCAERAGRLIEQPEKRETAPGIFLPAAFILKADPLATVLIFPSDHYISPGGAFAERVAQAALLAERWQDKLVLLGAVAEGPEPDYGWIEPVRSWSTAAGAMRVSSFREKPCAAEAAVLFGQGCLWNTMVMAVKIKTLWNIGRACLPGMMAVFDDLLAALGTAGEDAALAAAYRDLDSHNFSSEIVERVPERVLVLPMIGVEWSDLGRPARVLELRSRLLPGLPASPAVDLAGAGV